MQTEISPPVCLVVDDEPRLRQVILHLMRNDGFFCYEAGDGADALALLEEHPATLVLTDIRMPKMDGIELLRHVRARYPETAVMMLTAVADVESAVSCFAIGALDYLTKPFNLEEVRARVGQALERRRLVIENREYRESLEEKVAAQARRLEELFLASIQSLAEALEVKDPYTRGHSARVSHYSVVLARALGLDDEMLRQIELGGHVHDIGKIGVREAVLNKPGPLTDEEYQHVMSHPIVGWRILSPLLAETPAALNIVRWHHERFDGRGVPDGLAGSAIPIEARIAAVADSLDAIASGRAYRPAISGWMEAIEEIRRHRGTQFDPDVVDAAVSAAATGALALIGHGENSVLPSRLRTPVRARAAG
jgi:response regulator RpfG family c-di-GMP phosphodiesterase